MYYIVLYLSNNCGVLYFLVCRLRWLDWMNIYYFGDLGSIGDYESSVVEFVVNYYFCNGGNIIKVECYFVFMEVSAELFGEILVCIFSKGFVCDDFDNFSISCGDYKIRYYCDCGTLNYRK